MFDPNHPQETLAFGRRVGLITISGLFNTPSSELYDLTGGALSYDQKFSRAVDRHLVKIGFRWQRQTGNREDPQNPNFTYQSLADALANIPSSVNMSFGAPKHKSHLDEFGGFFSDIFVPIAPMVALQAELRERGIPTYIFSNTNDLAVSHIRGRFPFFGNFDDYIFSYEHGAMKPDARLYEVVEKKSGHRGAELLYLDDRAENIAAGAARGWQVILQESPEASRAAIEKLGLLNHSA